MTHDPCPCGSDMAYADCCARLHQGHKAASVEALMRARFSAYCLNNNAFLVDSWHPDTRPASLDLEASSPWQQLRVISAQQDTDRGQVIFEAVWRNDEQWGVLQETSLFLRENGSWYYHSGETRESRLKPERNQPCPCGSGRKYKKCCAR